MKLMIKYNKIYKINWKNIKIILVIFNIKIYNKNKILDCKLNFIII